MIARVVGLSLLLLGLSIVIAQASYDCRQVRAWHRQYGTTVLLQLAKFYGVTPEQQRKARRCIYRR